MENVEAIWLVLVDVDMPRRIQVCDWSHKLRNPMLCCDWWSMVTWQMWPLSWSLRLSDLDNVSYPKQNCAIWTLGFLLCGGLVSHIAICKSNLPCFKISILVFNFLYFILVYGTSFFL